MWPTNDGHDYIDHITRILKESTLHQIIWHRPIWLGVFSYRNYFDTDQWNLLTRPCRRHQSAVCRLARWLYEKQIIKYDFVENTDLIDLLAIWSVRVSEKSRSIIIDSTKIWYAFQKNHDFCCLKIIKLRSIENNHVRIRLYQLDCDQGRQKSAVCEHKKLSANSENEQMTKYNQ